MRQLHEHEHAKLDHGSLPNGPILKENMQFIRPCCTLFSGFQSQCRVQTLHPRNSTCTLRMFPNPLSFPGTEQFTFFLLDFEVTNPHCSVRPPAPILRYNESSMYPERRAASSRAEHESSGSVYTGRRRALWILKCRGCYLLLYRFDFLEDCFLMLSSKKIPDHF